MHCICATAILAAVATRAPVESAASVFALADTVGALHKKQSAPEEEPRADIDDARHSVEIASLVVEARGERFMFPAPRAEFTIATTLKGAAKATRIVVDLRRAPFCKWPREGEECILCLAEGVEGDYELAGHHACVLPAIARFRSTIVGWVRRQGPPKEPDPFMEAVEASDTILFGSLTGLSPSGKGGRGSSGMFKVEVALLGYSGFRDPILVVFPAKGQGLAPPVAGRQILFLKGMSGGGGAFQVIDSAPLGGDGRRETISRRILAALGPRKGLLTTVQATLAEYESSWNERDIDRLINCHSHGNRLRRMYDRDAGAREALVSQLNGFSGEIDLALLRVRMSGPAPGVAPTSGDNAPGPSPGPTDTDGHGASAEVGIAISGLGFRERIVTRMDFVRESGEWLLADDGL